MASSKPFPRTDNDELRSSGLELRSRVRQTVTCRMLLLEQVFPFLHPMLLNRVFQAVLSARRQVERVVANDDNEDSLPQSVNETILIPEDRADQIIQLAQTSLSGTNVRLQKTDRSVEIIKGDDDEVGEERYH